MNTFCQYGMIGCLAISGLANAQSSIIVNQAGYYPSWPKMVAVIDPSPQMKYLELWDIDQQKIVKRLPLPPAKQDLHSKQFISKISFSQIHRQGHYRWQSNHIQSPKFEISKQVFQPLLTKLLRSYYLQRCGVALDDPQSKSTHPEDHLDDGVLLHSDEINQQGTSLQATGGWHDAGDYGKYVVTTSVAIAEVLDSYQRAPQRYQDKQLMIPESGNGTADLLDEMKVGLTWLLTMQRQDGAVYRKLSGSKWPSVVSPDMDQQKRYIYGVSSPETAKFAGVMAQAAKVFQASDPSLAKTYQHAAEQAWQWLATVKEQQRIDWYAEDDQGSGKYLYSEVDQEPSLLTDEDDRVWAATELWLLTRQGFYLDYIKSKMPYLKDNLALFEWKNPALLAVMHLIQDQQFPHQLRQQLTQTFLQLAQQSLQRSQLSQFGIANHRFVWGSNKMVAEEGRILGFAYQLTQQKKYLKAALAQLNFILGMNPQGLSFVTGIGEHRVQKVMHLFARAKNSDIEGLLVGGANDLAQDGVAPKGQGILSYIDSEKAYSVNEYAIDYNSALIGLLGLLETK